MIEPKLKQCPTCGKTVAETKDGAGFYKRIKCKDDFNVWYCTNNYTRYGCHGHRPGDVRCMDLG